MLLLYDNHMSPRVRTRLSVTSAASTGDPTSQLLILGGFKASTSMPTKPRKRIDIQNQFSSVQFSSVQLLLANVWSATV